MPVLALDATADPEISRAIFGEEVEFHHIEVLGQNVKVTQISDSTFYRRKLEDPETGYQDRVAALVSATNAGLVSHKGVIEAMTKAGKLPKGTLTANFNGLRGLDGMKHAKALVIAGRIEPPAHALEEVARALWPDRDMSLNHAGLIQARSEYRLKDGSTVPAVVRAHPDPLVNRVLKQKRDAELLQAFGRIRPIHATEPKMVYLLTSVPVPWLTVDHLVKLDEFLPDARASRGLVAGKGILPLAPGALIKLLPSEFATERAAKEWALRQKGSHSRDNNIYPASETLFRFIRYRTQGQRGSLTEAFTWLQDEAAVRAALEALHGRAVIHLEIPDATGANPFPEPSNETEATS
jgi:hypothetical protein